MSRLLCVVAALAMPARQRRISYDVLVSNVNLDYEGNCDIRQMKAAW
jgi:hypothetical protein